MSYVIKFDIWEVRIMSCYHTAQSEKNFQQNVNNSLHKIFLLLFLHEKELKKKNIFKDSNQKKALH